VALAVTERGPVQDGKQHDICESRAARRGREASGSRQNNAAAHPSASQGSCREGCGKSRNRRVAPCNWRLGRPVLDETKLERLARLSGRVAPKALIAIERRGYCIRGKMSVPISRVPRRAPPKPKAEATPPQAASCLPSFGPSRLDPRRRVRDRRRHHSNHLTSSPTGNRDLRKCSKGTVWIAVAHGMTASGATSPLAPRPLRSPV
jgi:hypothetical protein